MKVNRSKLIRKHLRFFRLTFGLESPYHILLDGNFIYYCISHKIGIYVRLSSLLQLNSSNSNSIEAEDDIGLFDGGHVVDDKNKDRRYKNKNQRTYKANELAKGNAKDNKNSLYFYVTEEVKNELLAMKEKYLLPLKKNKDKQSQAHQGSVPKSSKSSTNTDILSTIDQCLSFIENSCTLLYTSPPHLQTNEIAMTTIKNKDSKQQQPQIQKKNNKTSSTSSSSSNYNETNLSVADNIYYFIERIYKENFINHPSSKNEAMIKDSIDIHSSNHSVDSEVNQLHNNSNNYNTSDSSKNKLTKQQPLHYFVATQDEELRKKIRQIPGVPTIFANRTIIMMEAPSHASYEQSLAKEGSKVENQFEADTLEFAEKLSRKRKRDLDEEEKKKYYQDEYGIGGSGGHNVNEYDRRKRKKAKGPNPLSMKKSKALSQVKKTEILPKDKNARKSKPNNGSSSSNSNSISNNNSNTEKEIMKGKGNEEGIEKNKVNFGKEHNNIIGKKRRSKKKSHHPRGSKNDLTEDFKMEEQEN